MSTTPQETLATAIAMPQSSEVEIRAKISRLYYALYSHACEFHDSLCTQGVQLKKEVGAHKRLSQQLTNPTVTNGDLQTLSRQIGTKQQLAHEIRVKADYNNDQNINSADLAKCVRYVKDGLAIPLPKRAAA